MRNESLAFPVGTDSYSIDLALRHPSRDANSISVALSLEPFLNWGSNSGRCSFYGRLQAGRKSSDYSAALAKVAAWLDTHAAYFTELVQAGGEAELVLNHSISPMEEPGDQCFELRLEPEFLRQLSFKGIALRIQGWQVGSAAIS
jgi:hypothetical protein